ncbi:MAG: S8 family serine peptidase [Limisphaerales bacterium]
MGLVGWSLGAVAATELTLRVNGRAQSFDLVTRAEGSRAPAGLTGQQELIIYPRGRQRSEWTRRTVTRQVRVKLAANADRKALAVAAGVDSLKPVHYAPGYYLLEATSPLEAIRTARILRNQAGVSSSEVLLGRRMWPRRVPNDTYFTNQWHLLNTGQYSNPRGVDLNVTNVWDTYRGAGITIAIVDDGVEYTHPDLAPNVNTALGYDYRDGDTDPAAAGGAGLDESTGNPRNDSHGTAVAGVAAGRGDNGIGIAGVAYEASLVAVRLIGTDQTDAAEGGAIAHSNTVIHVSNNSWGPNDDGRTKSMPGALASAALRTAATLGRGGAGTILVWAGGNGAVEGDNANYEGYNSSIYTLSVGALNDLGKRADYSERGACLIVSAPSGGESNGRQAATTTTDRTTDQFGYNNTNSFVGTPDEFGDLDNHDYTQGFNGTSSAAPMVAGSVALLLNSRSTLGWRDVQEILIRSASKNDPTNSEWLTNAAGFQFNPNFGAGLINVSNAVHLAVNWTNLPPQIKSSAIATNLVFSIPNQDTNGRSHIFDMSGINMRVEHAQLVVNAEETGVGDLAISLISPAGTVSPLAETHRDGESGYFDHQFLSVFNWGENGAGKWTVKIADNGTNYSGGISALELRLYGTPLDRGTVQLLSLQNNMANLRLNGAGTTRFIVQASTNLTAWESVGNATLSGGNAMLSDSAATNRQRYYRLLSGDLAPDMLSTNRIVFTVTGGASPFATSGSFALLRSVSNYSITNITGNINRAGSYTYGKPGPFTGRFFLEDNVEGSLEQTLHFLGQNHGFFGFTNPFSGSGFQTGTFRVDPPAP